MLRPPYSNGRAKVADVINTLGGEVERLLGALGRQTHAPAEVAVVRGVRPNGRARNQGVAQTGAPLLVFIDDDAMPGDERLIERLIAPLLEDATIGVTGAAKLLPPGAPWFQRWAAREVPRIVHPPVETPLETNPDPPSFYCEITTTCCAMRRAVFEQAGGFDEELVRGVDTEFFVRLRRSNVRTFQRSNVPTDCYRFVLVPHAWTYHPAPATLPALLRKQFLYGYGHAQEVRRDLSRARGRALRTPLHAAAFLLLRTAFLLPNVFLPYSFAAPSWRPGFKPLKALASYASALGYVWGWYADRS
jgi:GT2 family glycosyltransferase